MKIKEIFIVLTCLSLLLTASCVFAQDNDTSTIYISPDGNSSGLTKDNPTNWNNAYGIAKDGDSIVFLNGTYSDFSNITVDKNINLLGSGNSVIDGNNKTGFLFINSNVNVLLKDLVFYNGETGDSDAGAIVNNGNLIINNSTFSFNTGWGTKGGAIHNNGVCTIYNSTFTGNTAKEGGAIFVDENGVLNVYNSTFTNGSAKFGGFINVNLGSANIYYCSFIEDYSKFGSIYVLPNPVLKSTIPISLI